MNKKGRNNQYGNMNELEKQVLRINTLEVHVKRLLKFEEQFRKYMYGNGELGTIRSSTESTKRQMEPTSLKEKQSKNINWDREIRIRDQKINELTGRLNKLEQLFQDRLSHQYERTSDFSPEGKINIQTFMSNIQKKVEDLGDNYLLLKEVQASLIKKVDEILEKSNLNLEEKKDKDDLNMQHDHIFKTLYIDKFYLDKYEQNNNFSQLGIKELSGALNIGATYGKDAIPKEVTEQVKEEMETMKKMKDDMLNQQHDSEQEGDIQSDEAFADSENTQSEEDNPFIEIEIEEDPDL